MRGKGLILGAGLVANVSIGRVFAVLCLALGVLGCGSGKVEGKQAAAMPGGKAKITLLHYFSGSLSGGVDDMVTVFNRSNAAYELTATGLDHEAFKTSIQDTLKTGTPPDLYSYWAGSKVDAILGDLLPIDDIWAAARLDESFPKLLVDSAVTYRGKKYLLPITQHYVAFFYNKAVFDRLGLSEPRTWAELSATAEKIKKAGIVPFALGSKTRWPAQFWFDYILLRTAGHEYRERLVSGAARFSDPEVLRAFRLWKELVDKGYFPKHPNSLDWDLDANAAVFKGEAAMTLMGTWVMGAWTDSLHRWVPGKDFDAFAFPGIDPGVGISALGPIDGIVIPLKALNSEGAKQVIAFLSSPDSQGAMSRGSGAFAPSAKVPGSIYTPLQNKILGMINASEVWDYNFDLIFPPETSEAGLDTLAEFLEFPELYAKLLKGLDAKVRGSTGN